MPERTVAAIVSTGRQDFGILRSTIEALGEAPDIDARLWAGGMHLRERFGRTIDQVRSEGFEVHRELDFLAEPPEPAEDAGRAVSAAARALAEEPPDFVVLLGDRSETLAIAMASTLSGTPIVHLHGGEETEGAVDNAFRHAITKLSQLHLVSHAVHARRVIQMGESPETVRVVGAPGLDNLVRKDLPGLAEIEAKVGGALRDPLVLVTVHPTTLSVEGMSEVRAVARAMEGVAATYVVTLPNADQGGVSIREFWEEWAGAREDVHLVESLGGTFYWGLLRHVRAVLGNSSSGIIEAPAAGAFAVNVGDRQAGRLRAEGVRDVPVDAERIRMTLEEVLLLASTGEKAGPAPFGPGPSAPRIVAAIREWLPRRGLRKRFFQIASFVESMQIADT